METDILNKNTHDSIGYEGLITIKLMHKDRVIETRHCKNNGTQNLFRYFTQCLTGTATGSAVAAESCPCKLVLFNDGGETIASANPQNFDQLYWTEDAVVSQAVHFDGSVTISDVKDTNNNIIGSSALFHFRVPFIYLVNDAQIAKLGLFPDTVTYCTKLQLGTISAYHKLLNSDKTAFNPITVPGSGGNFTIIVDWELRVVNKA